MHMDSPPKYSKLIYMSQNETKKNAVLTTKGLQIPRETLPGGTDFNTSTASAKVALSKYFSLTKTKRSPGKSSPPRSATPPATNELITMAVLVGSKGSWKKKNPQNGNVILNR